MGLGLKRGWHAVFDTCWAIDNIFNPAASQRILKKDTVTWEEHYEAMTEQITKNLEYCKRLLVTDELAKGAYAEQGPVMLQLKKTNKDIATHTRAAASGWRDPSYVASARVDEMVCGVFPPRRASRRSPWRPRPPPAPPRPAARRSPARAAPSRPPSPSPRAPHPCAPR